jgi:hypothetical protein
VDNGNIYYYSIYRDVTKEDIGATDDFAHHSGVRNPASNPSSSPALLIPTYNFDYHLIDRLNQDLEFVYFTNVHNWVSLFFFFRI